MSCRFRLGRIGPGRFGPGRADRGQIARRRAARHRASLARCALWAAVLAAVLGQTGCAAAHRGVAARLPASGMGEPTAEPTAEPAAEPGAAPFAARYVENGQAAGAARTYWTVRRLERARPWVLQTGYPPGARPARRAGASLRVGALFSHDAGGDHFCTASVVGSPGRDMLITAAHCVHGGRGRTYRRDIVFVPGYRDGAAPRGVWAPREIFVAGGWARFSDPTLDVAFIVLRRLRGRNIQDVLGANKLGVNQGFRHVVRVTGYPGNGEEAITCVNRTTQQSRYQMRFACGGYSPGTSGSPWVMRFDYLTHTGLVIGVIGGYQDGGDTAAVSYSPYFDAKIEKLFDEAVRRSLAAARIARPRRLALGPGIA